MIRKSRPQDPNRPPPPAIVRLRAMRERYGMGPVVLAPIVPVPRKNKNSLGTMILPKGDE